MTSARHQFGTTYHGAPQQRLYQTLGLQHGVDTKEDAKKVYRKLVIQHHPDKGGNPDLFRAIQEAYDQIVNSEG